MTFSFVALRKVWFAISGVLCALSLLAVLVYGLPFGLDFTGGTLMEVTSSSIASRDQLVEEVKKNGVESIVIQETGEHGWVMRSSDVSPEEGRALIAALKTTFPDLQERRLESIGPSIGKEVRQSALWGVVVTLLLIGGYLIYAFRQVAGPVAPWKYSVLTMLAAFHDMVIPIGAFAVFGAWLGWEVDAAFVAAMLTILGYSINDTVVLFDRTREHLKRHPKADLATTVEMSIRETLRRSLFTSLTTLLALFAVAIFGGESTQPFAAALIIGIVAGTYSSIFLASCGLVAWQGRMVETKAV